MVPVCRLLELTDSHEALSNDILAKDPSMHVPVNHRHPIPFARHSCPFLQPTMTSGWRYDYFHTKGLVSYLDCSMYPYRISNHQVVGLTFLSPSNHLTTNSIKISPSQIQNPKRTRSHQPTKDPARSWHQTWKQTTITFQSDSLIPCQ